MQIFFYRPNFFVLVNQYNKNYINNKCYSLDEKGMADHFCWKDIRGLNSGK